MENGSDYNQTITFSISSENEAETRNILRQVYDALLEKGYNPINQLAGYILSEDPRPSSYRQVREMSWEYCL